MVPLDWSNYNTVEIVGGGGGGGSGVKWFAASGIYYGSAGAGGGYVKVDGLVLKPGDYINVTVGAGGTAGIASGKPSPYGNEEGDWGGTGGTTIFGNYMQATGGFTSAGDSIKRRNHTGGSGSTLPALVFGTYNSYITANGQNKNWDTRLNRVTVPSTGYYSYYGNTIGNPVFSNLLSGTPGSYGYFSNLPSNYQIYGSGGFGEYLGYFSTFNYQYGGPIIRATSGQQGFVRITYEPSGTQQACVWIS